MRVFTNINYEKYKGVTYKPFGQLIRHLVEVPTIAYDVETYAKNFDRTQVEQDYIREKKLQGKKITAATQKAAIKYAEELRNEMCLDPYRSGIALMQIATPQDDIFIIDCMKLTEKQYDKLMLLISGKQLIGQNLKFDLKVTIANSKLFKPGLLWDTMIAYKLIRTAQITGFFRSNLARVTAFHTGVQLTKGQGTSDWSQPLTEEQMKYAVEDVQYMFTIAQKQIHELNKRSVMKNNDDHIGCYDMVTIIEMRFVEPLAYMELSGIPVNVAKLQALKKEYDKTIDKEIKVFEKAGVNPRSPAQVLTYLADEYPDEDILSTDKRVLARYTDLPIVRQLLSLKTAMKASSMIEDYLGKWNVGGRIYASYNQLRAASGRMSSSNPNAQQFPHAIKDVIYAPTKRTAILRADYSNIEARCMAAISRDETLIRLFQEGGDMHKLTASRITRQPIEKVNDDQRFKAKSVNFGFMYGMGAKTFVDYAFVNYGIEYTLEEAMDIRNIYLSTYKGIKRLHNHHGTLLNENQAIIQRTILGRLMKVERFTDANNYPVQGSAAEIIKLALGYFWGEVKNNGLIDHVKPINIVHDELVIECTRSKVRVVKKLFQYSMEMAVNFAIEDFATPVEVEVIS